MWFCKSFSPNFSSISTFVNQLKKIKIDGSIFPIGFIRSWFDCDVWCWWWIKRKEEKVKNDTKPDLYTKTTNYLIVFNSSHWSSIKLNEGQRFVHRRKGEKNSRETILSRFGDRRLEGERKRSSMFCK